MEENEIGNGVINVNVNGNGNLNANVNVNVIGSKSLEKYHVNRSSAYRRRE